MRSEPSIRRSRPSVYRESAFKPSYSIAEATLFVSTIEPSAEQTVSYFDREQLAGE